MQVSSKNLSTKTKKKIFTQLHTLIADLHNQSQVETVLKDFLTDTEYLVLAKRLDIAVKLDSGESYDSIRKSLKVSSATISSVSELLSKGGMQIALQKIKVDKWAVATANKIQKWFKKS